MKKTLAVIEKYFIPVTAGIEVNMLNTYSVLQEQGWDVTVHTSRDTLTQKDCLEPEDLIRGLKVKRYKFGFFGFWPKVDWNNTDYVCLHNFNVFPHLFLMLYALGLKIVGKKKFKLFLTPHGGFNPEWSIFPLHIRVAKMLYHYTLGALVINLSVDGVRAVSEWEKAEMIKHGLRKNLVVVIANGLEDEAFLDLEAQASEAIKKQVEGLGRYLIQIGRVYVIKNYETVIRALVNVDKDVKFVIVGPVERKPGEKDYKDELEELITSLGLQDRVLFLGVITGVDKFYMIKHAQMMVHMAKWESFCNVVHEGLSQGRVCVVANNTALPLLIKDGVNGYCVETYDDKELTNKINYVLHNKETPEIKKIEETNFEHGRQNTWRSVAMKMYNFYLERGEVASRERGISKV
ncbi:glycosyltransferase family 4 protein [Patescibacteria group bacterium]|nr:glycosyltransferase family 4 protein [Patescibacteria group bacterium]